jgi:hypothetical protein
MLSYYEHIGQADFENDCMVSYDKFNRGRHVFPSIGYPCFINISLSLEPRFDGGLAENETRNRGYKP